ncbi:unnamed protein product [Pedinophyceae sp. YPF-701]|nr:unnamed protein product [Pedinophyceae sp. YPF-701]
MFANAASGSAVCATKAPSSAHARAAPFPRAAPASHPFTGCRSPAGPHGTFQAQARPQSLHVVRSAKGITYTSYEGNSFKINFKKAGVTLLIDPWLVGDLTFGGLGEWFYAGKKVDALPPFEESSQCDAIVLTQGLDDHAHKPTLERLDKEIPVIASPTGAEVARSLGFRSVTPLPHGASASILDGRIKITATQGALVGPPWSTRENGFVMEEMVDGGARVYYEPHCDYAGDLAATVGKVDVVVSPVRTVSLGSYPLVKGLEYMPLVKALKPQVLVGMNNAETTQVGLLSQGIKTEGTLEQVPGALQAEGIETKFVTVKTGQPEEIALQ